MSLLEVEDLHVTFPTEDGLVRAVDGISYTVDTGKTLGIVGESGSGKSVSSLTTLGLTRTQGATVEGKMLFEGNDLIQMSDDQLRKIRGNEIAMIFQDPLSSLHPFFKVGKQLMEAVQIHRKVSRAGARARAVELLELVGIPDPARRVDQFPHEFSGGMRQRAMIAMALANEPKLLIADEPTTALDVTIQKQILGLIDDLRKRLGMAVILVTNDLGVIEHASAQEIFARPQHPYTWGLLKSIPRLDNPRDEDLVPISGRPPSLINRPSGCHFHPRCPYVRDEHKRIDPRLERVQGGEQHEVACLLSSDVRARIWRGLQAGETPAELKRLSVGTPLAPTPHLAASSSPAEEGDQ